MAFKEKICWFLLVVGCTIAGAISFFILWNELDPLDFIASALHNVLD